MKLLTLEEIEKIEANLHLQEGFPCSQEDFGSLLDTARAYWEMFAIHNDTPTLHKDRDDKPHAPTIKVIVEALEEAREVHTEYTHSPIDLNRAIRSLEKHLE